ncbi:MAG: hypothetical protein JNJ52_11495 [Flavobacterium sp.]|nr:hypothetical protein [Flavobacterium sp.]
MKKLFILLFLVQYSFIFAQKDCEFTTNVTDSLGTYKSTKEYIMHERFFGGSEKSLFFSLINNGEFPSLKVQLIQKNSDFIPVTCFDESSKVFVQLENGKIITLLGANQSDCGDSVVVENKNCRILTGYFLFMKDTFEELKNSPISILRIKYGTETTDYIIKEELISEIDKINYQPSHYFIDYLKCVE